MTRVSEQSQKLWTSVASINRAISVHLSGSWGNSLMAWSVFAPLIFIVTWWWTQGRYGFNPTDDGFILAQSWRIRHGEVPHVDFTSPRPVGSAVLHLPVVFLPTAMLAASRLLVVAQFWWIAWSALDLILAERRSISPFQQFLLSTTAFLLNVGVWPMMAWHTVDGLFLGVTALWLTSRRFKSRTAMTTNWALAWLVAGCAPLTKQGYVVIPVLIGIRFLFTRQGQAWRLAPLAALPALMYMGWVGVGSLPQIYGGSSSEFLYPIRHLFVVINSPLGVLAVVTPALAYLLTTNVTRSQNANIVLSGLVLAAAPLLSANVEFGLVSDWAYVVSTSLIIGALLTAQLLALVDVTILLIVGFAVAMSWGVPTPGLIAGSYLGTLLAVQWSHTPKQSPQTIHVQTTLRRFPMTVSLLVILLGSLVMSLNSRSETVYAERPQAELTEVISEQNFAFIKMGSQVATYLRDLADCLERFPAKKTAIIPDNPGLYPLLGLRNPFPSDWWLDQERSIDHNFRVARAVRDLNGSSDWLVLFQSYPAVSLPTLDLREVSSVIQPFAHVGTDTQILRLLDGIDVRCGSLQGKYRVSN